MSREQSCQTLQYLIHHCLAVFVLHVQQLKSGQDELVREVMNTIQPFLHAVIDRQTEK